MTSARSILGLSFLLAAAVGCDGTDSSGGPIGPQPPGSGGNNATGGGTGSGGGSATGGETGSGGGTTTPGVPLTILDGWVDGAGNTAMIQGAIFPYADTHTAATMDPAPEDTMFTGATACIKGEAAMVDLDCTYMPPATDCYGEFWGAAIGLNLNQPIVDDVGGDPMPYDASAYKGVSFEISGSNPPTSLRFKVENADGEFCTPAAKPILLGGNTVLFSEVISECWKAGGAPPNLSAVTKIAWQVVTNDMATVPFDFCVGNIAIIPN